MATFTSSSYDGRYLQLTITESVDIINNQSTLTWTLQALGGSSSYYTTGATTVTINGVQVYYKARTAWSSYEFPAAKGTVSGTITVAHDSDGTKSISVGFSTAIYTATVTEYGGTMTLTDIDRTAATVTITTSSITASGVTIQATANHTIDLWSYSTDGGSTYTDFSTTVGASASVILDNLDPVTTYSIRVRARRKTNQVYGTSSAVSITTLGASIIKSVTNTAADQSAVSIFAYITTYSSEFYHKLIINDGTSDIITMEAGTLTVGTVQQVFELTSAQRTTLLGSITGKSLTGTLTIVTYTSSDYSTQVGNSSSCSCAFTTSAANSAPELSEFTYSDSNTTTVAVTGDDQLLIQDRSKLQVSITAATAKNGATISSYSVVAGSTTKASTKTEFTVGTVSETGTVPIIVTAIDSRGYTSSVTANATVIEYEDLEITAATIRRINDVESYTVISIAGSMTPITIDDVNNNALTLFNYRYKKTSDEEYSDWFSALTSTTLESDDDSFSYASDEWLNIEFDTDYSYYVQFHVKDKLTSDSVILTVPQGTPLMSFRRQKVGINNRDPTAALDVLGEIVMNGVNVLGLVAALGNTEDLNDLYTGGIYTQAKSSYASTSRNYPQAIAGFLEVVASADGNAMQRYTAYDNSAVYVRTYNNSTWQSWKAMSLTTV